MNWNTVPVSFIVWDIVATVAVDLCCVKYYSVYWMLPFPTRAWLLRATSPCVYLRVNFRTCPHAGGPFTSTIGAPVCSATSSLANLSASTSIRSLWRGIVTAGKSYALGSLFTLSGQWNRKHKTQTICVMIQHLAKTWSQTVLMDYVHIKSV